MLLIIDGTEVTKEQINTAFAEGRAVLVHGRADGRAATSLALDGKHFDTRGQCHSMWEEQWTTAPETIQQCFNAAGAF